MAFLLLALVVTALLQVTFRYVLLEPLIWSEEAARYLLIWLSFTAGGVALRDGLHPRISYFSDRFPARWRHSLNVFLVIAIAAFLVAFIWISADVAMRYAGFASLGTGISQAVPRFALPTGSVLLLINVGALLLDNAEDRAPDNTKKGEGA